MPKKKLIFQQKSGFTLIEVIVATSIMILLFGFGLASFLKFQDRQQVLKAKEETEAIFDRAQGKAKSGKMGSCNILKGYQVHGENQDDNYVLRTREICQNSANEPGLTTVYTSPTGLSLEDSFDLYFRVLTGDVDTDLFRFYDRSGTAQTGTGTFSSQTIEISNYRQTYRFEITNSGEVSAGSWN